MSEPCPCWPDTWSSPTEPTVQPFTTWPRWIREVSQNITLWTCLYFVNVSGTCLFCKHVLTLLTRPVLSCWFVGSLPKWVVNRASQFVAPKVKFFSWTWKSNICLTLVTFNKVSLCLPFSGDEKDLQGVPEVSGVEEEAQPEPEAVDVSGAKLSAVHQCGGADGAARRLSGEHRWERPEWGEDAPQRRRRDLIVCAETRRFLLSVSVCWFVCLSDWAERHQTPLWFWLILMRWFIFTSQSSGSGVFRCVLLRSSTNI